ncbi:protein tyrosine/serine phosphatase [Mycoplana sp. BE70]|uniref:dual specificity protein phosphatase family protein n=1 Tax=Mycoplana sp. BE70 TaxID=2817775 RepID=UPI00285FF9C2|nr:dual specificity protein phosphatase family protein [Mycoplana sp. BE70]MDR6757043.1 protein tyrosine/serine phosphatase [Mycoplana sp. BE70]
MARRYIAWAGTLTALIAFVVSAFLIGLQLAGNFHEVIPGELYRSAQPSAAQIERYVRQYGIRTIVNLRGPSSRPWYQSEVATAERLDVRHFDFGMSSSRVLTLAKTKELVVLLRDAPKPILIHCRSGADRTGLVSLIYLHQIAGVDEEIAERQLSIRFGHVGIPFLSPAFAMDESWEALEQALGFPS